MKRDLVVKQGLIIPESEINLRFSLLEAAGGIPSNFETHILER